MIFISPLFCLGATPMGRKKSILDWSFVFIKTVVFFLFLALAIIFVEGIWMDFKEKKTSLTWDEEPIVDHPTTSFCFHDYRNVGNLMAHKMFSIGTDINITYDINTKR